MFSDTSNALARWLSFEGRVSRARFAREYVLLPAGVIGAIVVLSTVVSGPEPISDAAVLVILPALFLVSFGTIAGLMKRLHDVGLSAWWLMLLLLSDTVAERVDSPGAPLAFAVMALGALVGLLIAPGERGPNRFGPDPVAPSRPVGVDDDQPWHAELDLASIGIGLGPVRR